VGLGLNFNLFILRGSTIYPKIIGEAYREVCFMLIENLMKAYKKVILERNDLDKSLKTMSEFTEFLKHEIEVKYGSFLKGVKL